MNTLVELYDNETIFNISAAMALKPQNIVFVREGKINTKRKAPLTAILKKYCPGSKVFFFEVKYADLEAATAVFNEIEEKFGEFSIELTGGSGVLSYAAGRYLKEKSITAFIYDNKFSQIIYLSGDKKGKKEKAPLRLKIEDFIHMAGGRYLRHGHFDPQNFGEEIFSDAFSVWEIFLSYKSAWHRQVAYFQAISSGNGIMDSCLKFSGEKTVRKKDGTLASLETDVMKALEEKGILKNVDFFSKRVSFEFKNCTIKKLLNDFGVWLEMFVYKSAVDSGKFDDVDMSVIIDWNHKLNERDDVLNEIDVIVAKGTTPLFISCKAGNVSAGALNEIKTLSERFGGIFAKPVLVTCEELSEYSVKTYRRATELGIRVIELSDLYRENPAHILERIVING